MVENCKLNIKNIYKEYPLNNKETFETLQNINFKIDSGEFVSIIGPSGCGKSTLFNIISGIESPSSGEIFLNNKIVTNKKGIISYMPQKDYLLPWRTVLENTILGMEIQGYSKKEGMERASEYLELFGLEKFKDEYPTALSGGMKQRVALLRTILLENDVLLLDEPFGALDEITRTEMQQWLLQLREKFKHTIIFITHSIDEAIFLSDRVYVFSPRPAKVKYEMTIDFAEDRHIKIMTDNKFIDYKKMLLEELSY